MQYEKTDARPVWVNTRYNVSMRDDVTNPLKPDTLEKSNERQNDNMASRQYTTTTNERLPQQTQPDSSRCFCANQNANFHQNCFHHFFIEEIHEIFEKMDFSKNILFEKNFTTYRDTLTLFSPSPHYVHKTGYPACH